MVRSGFRSYFTVVKRQVCETPTAWLAFAALLAWMFGLYWSDLFVERSATAPLDFLQLRALWLAVEAVALLASYALMGRIQNRVSALIPVAGASVFAGTVLVLFAPQGATTDGLRIAGVVLTGIGSAALLSLQGIGFARKGPRPLLINVALALAVASLIDSALLYMPEELQAMVVSLLPAVCVVLVIVSLRGAHEPDARPSALETSGRRKTALRIVALPLVVGLAYGLMQRLTGDAYTAGATEVNAATIVSFFLSAVFLALSALVFDSRKFIKLVCFVTIPTIGVAFVMLPLFANAREAVQAICIIGFNSFYFMVWALWADEGGGMALAKRFALGLFVLVGAESLGSMIGMRVVSAATESGSTLAVVSLVVVYLLLMAAMFSFDRTGSGSKTASPSHLDATDATPADGEGPSLEAWAERYGLSARETEVFMLLAKGRNRVYISKELFISDNTTRTHMKNIYRKLEVHSQQELIDVLEGKTQSEGRS